MPLVFIFVAALFWLTIATVMAVAWAVKLLFHVLAAAGGGARGLIHHSQARAQH